MANNEIIVQLANPERKFVKVYQDFLQSKLLTAEEKIVFIALKSFVDFSKDNSGTQGEAYPTMETICKLSSLSRPRATRTINKLIEKKIVKKIRRGLTKSNVYILSDYATMWICESMEEIAKVTDNQGVKPLTPTEHIAELERMGYKVEIKKKELVSESDQTTDTSTQKNKNNNLVNRQNTTSKIESQDLERYTLDQIRELFDYDIMVQDYPLRQNDIDSVISILYTAMNTTKSTIRIAGEDKPAMVVIGKLMKLHKESIMYAIDMFSKQTERIKNPTAYMLTILYNAPEQFNLDIQNRVSHDMANWNRLDE